MNKARSSQLNGLGRKNMHIDTTLLSYVIINTYSERKESTLQSLACFSDDDDSSISTCYTID